MKGSQQDAKPTALWLKEIEIHVVYCPSIFFRLPFFMMGSLLIRYNYSLPQINDSGYKLTFPFLCLNDMYLEPSRSDNYHAILRHCSNIFCIFGFGHTNSCKEYNPLSLRTFFSTNYLTNASKRRSLPLTDL